MEDEIVLDENIIDTNNETSIEEEVIDNGPEESNIEEDIEEEDGEFDPEKAFEEDEGVYVIGGYDLSKYKETLGLENPENLELITKYAEGLESKGFTQDQIEYLIEREMVDEPKEEPKKPNAKEIKENLNKSLTVEEKRNYKYVNSYVNSIVEGTELSKYKNEIMQNPNLVKIMHLAYKGSLGTKTGLKAASSRTVEKQIKSVSMDDAYSQIMDTLGKGGDVKSLSKDLKGKVNDKDSFNQLMRSIGL